MSPADFKALLADQQHNRFLQLAFPDDDGPSDAYLLPQELHANECVGRDFEFSVLLLSDDPRLELKSLLGKRVTIGLHREDGSQRYFNGHVFAFSLQAMDGGVAQYHMLLKPWLALLQYRRDNYLFHGANVEQQTAQIFGDYPQADWAWRGSGADPTFTDACQYGETDYNYLHRRWEALGLFYWYEHRADGHTLVLCDDSAQCPAVDGEATMQWQAEAGSREDDGVSRFAPLRHVASTAYAAGSFDFKKPRPQWSDTPTLNAQGGALPTMEVYDYAGAYSWPDAGASSALTQRRIEAIEAQAKRFEALSNERVAQPGRSFTLIGHFDHGSGETEDGSGGNDAEFLILSVQHIARSNYAQMLGAGYGGGAGTGGGGASAHYQNTFTCLRKKIPWRVSPGFNSTEPKIYGLQTAIVVGPPGEEIHTDAYGRVRVQFHWDRVGGYDDKSSAWVRVASTWAGSNFGFMAVPRIGQEVLVQFLDGNPDRPLVTGRVYNADNMPPWDLPANQTQTGILSRSSKGGGYDNANAIRFEDKKGQEQLWLHAEKDQLTEVEHDEDKWVGNDRRKTIDRDETNHIKQDRTETVDRNEKITVHGWRTEEVDGNETITIHSNRQERVDHNETISIGDNRSEDVGQNETIAIGQNRTETVGRNESVTIGSNRSKTIGKNESDSIGKNWSIKVGKTKTETIGMAYLQNVGLGRMENVGAAYNLNVGGLMATVVGLNQSTMVGMNASYTVGKVFSLDAGTSVTIQAGETLILQVGESTISLNKSGQIDIRGVKINIVGSELVDVDSKLVDLN
jgi:type VI secretion system secreted protein VgrG